MENSEAVIYEIKLKGAGLPAALFPVNACVWNLNPVLGKATNNKSYLYRCQQNVKMQKKCIT